MSKKAVRLLIILLLFWVTGGQWVVLQSLAWVNMVRDYSRTDTVCHAISNTFDGNHPCPMCRLIQKQRSEESKNQKSAPEVKKPELFLVAYADLKVTLIRVGKIGFTPLDFQNWKQAPLSPPPKTA